jgi:hypothetical protein
LRKIAAQRMAEEQPGQTLQPIALVHEADLRLVGSNPDWPWTNVVQGTPFGSKRTRRHIVLDALPAHAVHS